MKAAKNEKSEKFADKVGETFQQFNVRGSNIISSRFYLACVNIYNI